MQVYGQVAYGYFGGSKLDASGYYALNPAGGAIVAWNDPGVYVNGTVSILGSYGAYIPDLRMPLYGILSEPSAPTP